MKNVNDKEVLILKDGHIEGTAFITVDEDNSKIGFFGATAVVQQSAPTAAHAAITQAGTDNGDVAIQAATNSSPYGYVTADEFEAHLALSINNRTRINEVITALQNLGLMATS